jgi:hypothetical protein
LLIVEAKWVSSACGAQPDLASAIADDFQGTSTKGRRYGKIAKRCEVRTDTWLKRAGKWQIVAAQDTIVPCNSQRR